MYYLNKIVGWMTSPIAVTFLVAVAGIVLARFGRRRLGVWLMGGAVAWFWLWATPVMTWIVGAPLEREFLVDERVPAVESFPEAGAIVLLGGSMGAETNLSSYAEMLTSADRVWQAARLWKAGKAPKIIATGDGAKESTLGLLKEMGVKEECVEFVDARNTEEEAKGVGENLTRIPRAARVAEGDALAGVSHRDSEAQRGGKGCGDTSNDSETPSLCVKNPKILLVTSAWHMKRARMMFEKYAPGVDVVCAPADFECTMAAKKGFSLLPDAYVFYLNSMALHEWIGIVGYGVFR